MIKHFAIVLCILATPYLCPAQETQGGGGVAPPVPWKIIQPVKG